MKIKHACGSHPVAVHAPYLGHPGNPRLLGRPRLVAIFLCTETVGQTSNDNADLVVIHYLHIPTASPQSKNCTHSEFKFTLNTSDLYPIFMSFLYIKKKKTSTNAENHQHSLLSKELATSTLDQVETSPMNIQVYPGIG